MKKMYFYEDITSSLQAKKTPVINLKYSEKI